MLLCQSISQKDKTSAIELEMQNALDLDADDVVDEAEGEITTVQNFQIDSYGADYTVDSLVGRMRSGAFFVPPFQRSYVWSHKQASRFIESLLLGLPVPGIFVFKEEHTGRHLVIDGQQRLKTLQFFFAGVFAEGRIKDKVFRLIDVRKPWEGKTYNELDEPDRLRLDDSVIHTIVFKQREPSNDQSIYEVFERINTTGVKLSDQEVRTCVNFGPMSDLLSTLNENAAWRAVYGDKSERLKDQELILRFLALLHGIDEYARPMKSFLNDFMQKYSDKRQLAKVKFDREFSETIEAAVAVFGDRAFRPEKQINAAVFDAVMFGLAVRLRAGPIKSKAEAKKRYDNLLQNADFQSSYLKATADAESVRRRIGIAVDAFKDVQ